MYNNKPLLYQIRIDVTEDEATQIREKGSSKLNLNLVSLLKKFNAKLVCQFDAFNGFVKECEQEGEINNPLYKWTKDTIADINKKNKYLKSFTIYVNENQLYDKKIADNIEKKLHDLGDKNILKINKYNSDPQNNPQPPKKYY